MRVNALMALEGWPHPALQAPDGDRLQTTHVALFGTN
jgi:hypothetical protein